MPSGAFAVSLPKGTLNSIGSYDPSPRLNDPAETEKLDETGADGWGGRWMFPKIGGFIMENPIKMDDLVVILFLETPKCYFCFYNTSDQWIIILVLVIGGRDYMTYHPLQEPEKSIDQMVEESRIFFRGVPSI